MLGETNLIPPATIWRILGKGNFPGKTCKAMAILYVTRRQLPPNGCGLLDMIGNMEQRIGICPVMLLKSRGRAVFHITYRGGEEEERSHRLRLDVLRKVLKGGSHLCAPNYCRRYRPAARHAEPIDTSNVSCWISLYCPYQRRIKCRFELFRQYELWPHSNTQYRTSLDVSISAIPWHFKQ